MRKFNKIAGGILVGIFGFYGLISFIYQLTAGKTDLVNAVLTLIIAAAVCLISYLSFFGKWGAFLHRFGRHDEASAIDSDYEYVIHPVKRSKYSVRNFKFNSASIAPALACLVGATVMFVLGGLEISKITGGSYLKAEAVIESVLTNNGESRLLCVFEVNGRQYFGAIADSWSGVKFIAGNTVTIYYQRFHPEIVMQLSSPIMMFMGGFLFTGIAVIAFLAINRLTAVIGIPAGLIFMCAGICFQIAEYYAGGFNFLQLALSGALAFGCNFFIIIGLYCICAGVGNIIRYAKGYEV
ncbi:MAG: hypothetical protein K2L42_02010 [Clostridia bacterium]|nr:hypothetical protein [Clostridia bacterium]